MGPIDSFIGVLLLIVVLPILAFAAVLGLFALLGGGLGALSGLIALFNFTHIPPGKTPFRPDPPKDQ